MFGWEFVVASVFVFFILEPFRLMHLYVWRYQRLKVKQHKRNNTQHVVQQRHVEMVFFLISVCLFSEIASNSVYFFSHIVFGWPVFNWQTLKKGTYLWILLFSLFSIVFWWKYREDKTGKRRLYKSWPLFHWTWAVEPCGALSWQITKKSLCCCPLDVTAKNPNI